YFEYGERAVEGANEADGPFSAARALLATAACQAPHYPQREQPDPHHQQDAVVGHLEDPHQHDAESGERDQRARHHQAEAGFLSHDQMTASRRNRSISSAAYPASLRISAVCAPRVGGSRSSPRLPCPSRNPAPTSRIGP